MTIARAFLALAASALGACAAGPVAVAEPPPVTAAALAGTRWVGVVGEGVDPRHAPRLEFVREGRVSGFTGCNMLTGGWTLEGGVARMGPVATTKRFCVGPEMDLERRVLAAMGDGARIGRRGDELVITGATGGATMTFRPAP